MSVDSVLDDRQLSDQCWVERHQTQLCGDKFDEVGRPAWSAVSVPG